MTSRKGQHVCYLILALLSLISCNCKETAEEFQVALGKPSRLYGPVKKEGYLPLRRCGLGVAIPVKALPPCLSN